MAAKLSDLADEMSGANLQAEGHMDVPTQSVRDVQELEALDCPPSGCPNMKYCLEIHVTLMEELGAIPPPSHSWMAPLWKICCMMLELDSLKQW